MNKKRSQVVINQYPENHRLLQKDKEKVQRVVPGYSSYSEIVIYGRKFFIISVSMVKGLKVKDMNSNLKNISVRVTHFPQFWIKHLYTFSRFSANSFYHK